MEGQDSKLNDKKQTEENFDQKDLSVEYVDDEEFEMEEGELVDEEEFIQQAKEAHDEQEKETNEMDVEEELTVYTKEFENFKTDGEIYALDMNDKGIVVIGDGEDTTYFFDISKKELIKKEKLNKDSISCVKYSNDYTMVATASLDGSVNVFDCTKNFELLGTVNGSFSEINWLDWHPKGPVFAFGCNDGSVWIYQAKQFDNNMSFFGHTDSVSCGNFTPDGKYLVTGSEDTSVKIWDLKNNSIKDTIKGKKYHKAPITCQALGKTKSVIATGSFENEIGIANYDTLTVNLFV